MEVAAIHAMQPRMHPTVNSPVDGALWVPNAWFQAGEVTFLQVHTPPKGRAFATGAFGRKECTGGNLRMAIALVKELCKLQSHASFAKFGAPDYATKNEAAQKRIDKNANTWFAAISTDDLGRRMVDITLPSFTAGDGKVVDAVGTSAPIEPMAEACRCRVRLESVELGLQARH